MFVFNRSARSRRLRSQRTENWFCWIVSAVLVLAMQPAMNRPAYAQDSSPEVSVEPEARAALQAAFARLEATRSFSVSVRRSLDVVQASGQKLQFESIGQVLIRRPDRARVTLRRDDGQERRMFYNGADLVILDVGENAYARVAVPSSIDAMLDFAEMELGSEMPLADLLYNDLTPLIDAAVEGAAVGEARVGDRECSHLAFRGTELDWQFWIDPDHVIRKIVMTDWSADGAPQLVAEFRDWNFDADAPDAAFEFDAPGGAERISTLAVPAPLTEDPKK